MDTLKIGQIINSPQERDAVHMAIAPVEAGERLGPGTHVKLFGGKAVAAKTGSIGIIDPFLKVIAAKGDKVWLFLYPGSITSLRHNWTHPTFPDDLERTHTFTGNQSAEARLRAYCEKEGVDYEKMLDGFVGDNEGFQIPYELKGDYKTVTGEEAPDYFSCAC